jgi:LmbE family N-acetylglucosaminyl deacetylase
MPDIPTPAPDITKAKRILAVQPHYDDNDIAAGGTLAALAAGGAEVFYLTVTDDLVGFIDQTMPEADMAKQLRAEQHRAGEAIGVKDWFWLGYPDAGRFDHFDLRRDIIGVIRQVRPDFVFTCDPWTPYEAHYDHVRTGFATAEATALYSFDRLAPDSDAPYEPFELMGVVFYASAFPNTVFDISATIEQKNRALHAYLGQFEPEDLDRLADVLTAAAAQVAQDEPFQYGEPLKVLATYQLHVHPTAIHE